MNIRSTLSAILPMSAFALVAAGGLSSAGAQERYTHDENMYANEESIVVEAPYARRETVGREPKSGIPRQLVSYNIPVSIADLDFSSAADRARLEDRIHEAAWEACRQLDRRYSPSIYVPETSESRSRCADRAADDAFAQARMIADARASGSDYNGR